MKAPSLWTPEEKAAGRSLPFPHVADFPIRAYEFYDFHHEITGVPNSYIVNITRIDVDEACEVKPTWNAAVGRATSGA